MLSYKLELSINLPMFILTSERIIFPGSLNLHCLSAFFKVTSIYFPDFWSYHKISGLLRMHKNRAL